MAAEVTEVKRRQITQQGTSFVLEMTAYDTFARPAKISKSSSLGFARRETNSYDNNTNNWVIGQLKEVRDDASDKVIISNVYNPMTATLTSVTHFGNLQRSMLYHDDGTIRSIIDGKNQATTYSDYARGIARLIRYPTDKIRSAVVNNIGRIDSLTDENGYTTGFGYDVMGRLAGITYPANDTQAWSPTIINVLRSPEEKFGLPTGHWQQRVSTGTGYSINYYDELLRPVYTEQYDSANPSGTVVV